MASQDCLDDVETVSEPTGISSQEPDLTESRKAECEPITFLSGNPFVPPTGDTCFINDLPPELLSRIFEIGAIDEENEDDEDDGEDDFWEAWAAGWRQGYELAEKILAHEEVTMEDDETEKEKETDDKKNEDGEWSDTTGSSDLDSPWPPFQTVVSHVCRHWRNVAFSTPSLWTTIEVTHDARPPYEHVSTLLERSKGLPIDIYIDCEPPEEDPEEDVDSVDGDGPSEDNLKFLYSLLVPHVQRWHSIKVEVSSYHHMYAFLSAVSDPSIASAPQLTALQLYHHEDKEEFESFSHPSLSKHFTLFGGSAPNLTDIALWGVHTDWNQSWIASASNLRDLELAYHTEDVRPSWAQFSTILRGAPKLENLSLCLSGPSGEPTEWVFEPTPGGPTEDLNSPIQLLKMTEFVLAFQSPSRAIGLLRKLYIPSLKSLTLDFDDGDYTDLITQLAGPATSISPPSADEQPRSLLNNLESLKIAGLDCRTESVETLYGELQNLQSLNISAAYLPHLFLDLLCQPCTLPGYGDIWLPRLRSLWISGTSGDSIRDVVQKRMDVGVPLTSLYIEDSCDVDDDDEEWFRANVETFDFFEGSDDEEVVELDGVDEHGEDGDEWSDVD